MHIAKQQACQKYIYKIHSSRLRTNRWKLTLTIEEARRNDEVISLADSQMLRWIDEINGITDADCRAHAIRSEIRKIRNEDYSIRNKHRIQQLYQELDSLQFKRDYMCLIIDREKDYYRACKGFSINGIRYKRLLGTVGGIKNSTIVFVSERIVSELKHRIENGRDPHKKIVTAKLEAYKALTCSASIPVSMPHGILVVDDAETDFIADVINLTDENDGDPLMEEKKGEHIHMDATDGFGLMLPSLAARWSMELGLDYVAGGMNTRFSFEKGMIFAFDFLDFAENVAGRYIVKDAWGDEVDIRNVELILTTSMLKLYDSYESCSEYIRLSTENGYTFGIAKTCPRELENERALNYQFIQSYDLSDEDIDELIEPTMRDIRDALGDDWRKSALYLRGSGMTAKNVDRLPNDYVKSIMIDERVLEDSWIRGSIYQLIRNRINEAKVGVLNVHGNYSILSGDPYLLCQSIFGLPLTGLLRAGEIFNLYWAESGAERLVCFRAPMTCHNNIRSVIPVRRKDALYWYRYMPTATVFNAFDTATAAMNGCDYDGDLVFLTDNPVLVKRHVPMPALMCAQRKAEKRVSSEEDFIRSNIASFGNEIGQTTNWITSMFEVRSHFPKGSIEYETLSYRICCGQLFQQNTIDKAKGIVCKPMPRAWHDRHEAGRTEDPEKRDFMRRIAADKKPYFMRYIYPDLMNQYNNYIKNTQRNALREFHMTVEELQTIPEEQRTERQNEFLKYYKIHMPVGTGDCVMNRICRKFEEAFDGYIRKRAEHSTFDWSILKSDAEYPQKQYYAVKKLIENYNRRLANYRIFAQYERVDDSDALSELLAMDEEFRRECDVVCPNGKSLCNIVLDLCYRKNSSKSFAWRICGDEIIGNMLAGSNGEIRFPTLCENGAIEYGGKRFAVGIKRIGG